MQDVLWNLLKKEECRQKNGINLIASENYCSEEVMKMVGSVLMNKYVEGAIGNRYYSGCQFVDEIEQETINRFKTLFNADHANVQPHSGSQANFAVYMALLKPGDTILSMKLSDGGHLTHGHAVNLSGQLYKIVHYGVDQKTYDIDYVQLQKLAEQHQPKLIIAGASSFPNIIDFEQISKIAKNVKAYFLADVAHTAGLIAARLYPSPIAFADVVTFTTHKTFLGPRGGVILCRKELATQIDRAVMPGIQGGAFMHEIAAKGIACAQAMQPDFIQYQEQVLANAKIMQQTFEQLGYSIVFGRTHTHMLLIDVSKLGLTGKQAEQRLQAYDIFVNRNMIPFDTQSALITSGIRLGVAAITTRGATSHDIQAIVVLIDQILRFDENNFNVNQIKQNVLKLTTMWK